MQPTDHSIVVPSISRDMRALYDAHFAFVWRYMAHRGVPPFALDDVVQDVFRIVREHPSRHDPARSRSVFVCMIARQVLREYKKRNGSQRAEGDDGESPTTTFSRHAAAQMLDAVLDGMTEMQREVYLLCEGEKMSPRDTGDALGVSAAIVERRLESANKLMHGSVTRLRAHPLWESLSERSRDGRALLEAAQTARTPSDRDRERVFAAMLAASLTGAPVAGLETISILASPVTLPPAPLSVKRAFDRSSFAWAAAGLIALAIGFGSYAAVSSSRGNESTASTPELGSEPVAENGEEVEDSVDPGEAMPAATTPTSENADEAPKAEPRKPAAAPERSRARSRRSIRRPAQERKRADSAEARQLFAAERALRSGETKTAIELINDHERRFPESQLSTERSVLRAQVLCEQGRTRAARRVVLELEAAEVDRPMLASVDQACMNAQ